MNRQAEGKPGREEKDIEVGAGLLKRFGSEICGIGKVVETKIPCDIGSADLRRFCQKKTVLRHADLAGSAEKTVCGLFDEFSLAKTADRCDADRAEQKEQEKMHECEAQGA